MLAIIADLYTPLFCLASLWMAYQNKQLKNSTSFLFYSTLTIFACSGIDLLFGIWSSLGLDFSTHTAITLPFLQLLIRPFSAPIPPTRLQTVVWLLLALSYYLLMVSLNYHSLMDILTTLIAILPMLVWIKSRYLKA